MTQSGTTPGANPPDAGHERLRVLYVHSSASERARMQQLLEADAFDVVAVESPREALVRAAGVAPDLVVFDARISSAPELHELELSAHRNGPHRSILVAHKAAGDGAPTPPEIDAALEEPADAGQLPSLLRALYVGSGDRHARGESVATLEREVAQISSENDRLRSEARVRGDFMRNLAHELATPLTPLVGYLKLLRSGKLGAITERQQQVLDAMGHATERLEHSIDNLVDYASLETGKYRIHAAEFDAGPMIDDCVRGFNTKARMKHVRVDVRKPESIVMSGDQRKLRQSLTNVLDNALRLSPHGGRILVEISETPDDVTFAVFDQGPGLPPELREAAESPVLPKIDDRTGGAGLGLAVVRQVVTAHGGELFLESPPREQPDVRDLFPGTRVAFRIPRRPPETPSPSAAS
jgi:signal transduction histidine kinase